MKNREIYIGDNNERKSKIMKIEAIIERRKLRNQKK